MQDQPLRLLTVARLSSDKGHRFALEAIRILAQRGLLVEYRVVGTGPEGSALGEMSKELGIADRVRFLGELDDEELRQQYGEAHIFILPSLKDRVGRHEETQGVAIQEAQASGAIVIATRVGGVPECVDDGRSAFLVADRDAAALAERIEWIASHPCEWMSWQRTARAWVELHFDMNRIGDQLRNVYQEALQIKGCNGSAGVSSSWDGS